MYDRRKVIDKTVQIGPSIGYSSSSNWYIMDFNMFV